MDVAEEGDENECRARCGFCCPIGIAVGWGPEDDVFLKDLLIDDNAFDSIIFALPPLRLLFPHL